MKLKDGLILREVAGQFVIVPTGKRVREVSKIHYMTKDAAMLWNSVYGREFDEDDLMDILKSQYPKANPEQIQTAVKNFMDGIKSRSFLDNHGGTEYISYRMK